MTRRAWLLALAAVAVRAVAALLVRVVDSDGARNLQMALLMEQGRFADALRLPTPTPPLHPFLSTLLNIPIHNMLVAGVAVSVILGGLAVLPLYAMTKRVWDERIATPAGLLYALLPAAVDVHVEPMTEGTFVFFFLTAAWAGWLALEERSWERTAAAALCAALAWLARPEGIYLLPLFAIAAALRFSRFSLPLVALHMLLWLILAFPYLSFIHGETGRWQPSLSPIPGLMGDWASGARHPELAAQDFEEYRVVARHGALIGGGGHLLANFFGKVLFYALGPFLIWGFFRPRPADGARPLLAYGWIAAALYIVPVALSFVASTPFSHRFLLMPAILVLPTAAAGIARASERVGHPRALPLIAAALCLAMAIRDVRVRRAEKVGVKEAGQAVLKTMGPGRRVYSTNRAAEFYAKSGHLEAPIFVTLDALEALDADAYILCPADLRTTEERFEERFAARHPLQGEYPFPPRPGVHPVRVYLRRAP